MWDNNVLKINQHKFENLKFQTGYTYTNNVRNNKANTLSVFISGNDSVFFCVAPATVP